MWIFSDILSRAYDSWIVPLIGFFVLPGRRSPTRACGRRARNQVFGFEWFIVGLAFVLDLGSYVGGNRRD